MAINLKHKTDQQRLAYNTYMRDFRKRPGQVKKETARKNAWIAASPENAEKHRRNCEKAQRRLRWGSPEEYTGRLAKQNGRCALCGELFDDTELGSPVQDHDHETGELREFLHRRCNLGIGNFFDDSTRCQLAVVYLRKHGR